MTLHRLPLTLALQATLAAGTGKPVGLARIPDAPPVGAEEPRQAEPPFAILYSISGTTYSGPWADAHADAAWMYQVTAVANRADQAEWLMDRVRSTLLSRNPDGTWTHPISAAGMTVMSRLHVADAAGDSEGSIVSLVERYALSVTPSD